MTQKGQIEARKIDKNSVVNISETEYNERQEELVTEEHVKDFKELDLTDNFMFSAVMKDPELANFLRFLTDGRPVDEYTERLVEAVEAARNNEYLNLEYMSMFAMKTDARSAGRAEGRAEGLFALVTTLKSILKDFDKVYRAVRSNEVYADVSREEVMEYYKKCP